MISRRSLFWLLLVLTPVVLAACSNTSDTLGQIHQGRILMLTVVEMNRTDELRYSTIDPSDVIRKWRLRPSKEGLELLLMRLKVENHIAVSAIFVADQQAASIRGFLQDEYLPLTINDTIYLDVRGQADATVTLEGGECLDHVRLVVNAGTNVEWANRGETASAIQFDPGVLSPTGADPLQVPPGGSASHRFDQPGKFDYRCSGGEDFSQPAQILVEDAGSERGERDNNILFLEGSFELPRGTAVDGWMVFEVPKDVKIRDLRWRAGDSITIRF